METLHSSKVTLDYALVEHYVYLPNKIFDYDYNINGERFVPTYIHAINIKDKTTEQIVFSTTFSSESCAQIISRLYELENSNDVYSICDSGDPIIIGDTGCESMMYIYYDLQMDLTKLQFINFSFYSTITSTAFKFRMDKKYIDTIIQLLANDPLVEKLFVIYSSDRDN